MYPSRLLEVSQLIIVEQYTQYAREVTPCKDIARLSPVSNNLLKSFEFVTPRDKQVNMLVVNIVASGHTTLKLNHSIRVGVI